MSDSQPSTRDETEAERLDRNFADQLQELRIAQAGVQILFAFLLTIPFQQRFTTLTDLQRSIYVVTLLAVAVSTLVFMAPVAMHRMLFREGLKDFVVRHTDTLIRTGLFFLGVGIIGGVVLVLDVLLSQSTAFWLGGGLTVLAFTLWVLLPASQRRRRRREDAEA
ncbi:MULTISPECIES: DUF6328 family protein [Arsenicicoccus]|uniref:DUF6328 family protein n=1 Tax=Arsenicicoccus bolidensis TaxID=229480 RepID=A0ABS9Q6I5_9MICO|nr:MULTISPECIES: DUF6328 family protein [Arsenicicoccus]AKT50820.1 hypothetical protein ADJ73_04990 [Arsenicicoccus sp. oral taxon 190]MCG7323483.1 DUF6328 family protein [Arsenicicoccus bolidensis]